MNRLKLTKSQLLSLIVLLVALVATFFFVDEFRSNQELDESPAGQVFNQLEENALVNEQGQPVALDVRDRQVKVVAFWASWVPQSPALLSALDEVAEQAAFQNVRFLAVNRSEPASRVEAYFSTINRPTTVEIVTDTTDRLFDSLDSYAMPEIVIFSENGDIAWRKRGETTVAELTTALQNAL